MACTDKVLICDDEETTLRLVKVHFTRLGMHVLTAPDGRQALEIIRRERPRIVVLDVVMPHVDGYEVLRAIREDPDLIGTYVVVLTAMAQDEDARDAYRFGADSYLAKPFDPSALDVLVQAI